MDRLTYEKRPSSWNLGKYPTNYTSRHTFQKVVARLAAYEDTGLTPEDIDVLKKRKQGLAELLVNVSCGCAVSYTRLAELAKAEKDGRLVVLPCKVGDAVYFPVAERWDVATIDCIEIDSNGVRFGWVQYDVGPEVNELYDDGCFVAEDIGKTVFLTREEAEAALKKRKEADNEAD